jgi:hypothetical protein
MIVIVRTFANNTAIGKQRLQTAVKERRRERDELLSSSIFFGFNVRRSPNIKLNRLDDESALKTPETDFNRLQHIEYQSVLLRILSIKDLSEGVQRYRNYTQYITNEINNENN